MSKTLVVSQPMFLPWLGLFEQVHLTDVFIHYNDVQLPQGRSFMSRVQIKTGNGIEWLTAPIDRVKSGKLLNQVIFSTQKDWRIKHLKKIQHNYAKAPYFGMMFSLIEEIYSFSTDYLSEFNINAIEKIADLFMLKPKFMVSSDMSIGGSSTERLVALCQAVGCDIYVTGHGALNYLNYQLFEDIGITVKYMNYRKVPYPQEYGDFTPYVSILDVIANCGLNARDLLCSDAIYWRELNDR